MSYDENNIYEIKNAVSATNLNDKEKGLLTKLIDQWEDKLPKNQLRNRYYEDKAPIKDIGIAVPDSIAKKINTSTGWAAIAVDSMAERSSFDGFVVNDAYREQLDKIVKDNNFIYEYEKAVPSELIYSCGFWAVTKGKNGPKIRFYDAENATGLWDYDNQRIKAGFVIADYKYIDKQGEKPSMLQMHTEENVIVIKLNENNTKWVAKHHKHSLGICSMQIMAYRPTERKYAGKSRISRAVRSIIDEYQRCKLRSSMHSEAFAAPNKYILGVSLGGDEVSKEDKREKVKAIQHMMRYNQIFVSETNENGELPKPGQLPQSSTQPHIDYRKDLASQMAAECRMPISYFGVEHSNPASAEGLHASLENLESQVNKLNDTNGLAVINVMTMALAIATNKSFNDMASEDLGLAVLWRNPSKSTLSANADGLIKLASQAPGLVYTDMFWKTAGFNEAERSVILKAVREGEAKQRLLEQGVPPIESADVEEEAEEESVNELEQGE